MVRLLVSNGTAVVTEGMQLRVDDAWTMSVTVVQASFYRHRIRWYVRQHPQDSDIVVFVRMSGEGAAIEDFVVAPRLVLGAHARDLSPKGFPDVEACAFASLSVLERLGHPDWVSSTASVAGEESGDDLSGALARAAQACRRHMSRVRVAVKVLHAFPGPLPAAWQRSQRVGSVNPKAGAVPHGEAVLGMVMLRGRVASLLAQAALVEWLARHHPAELGVLQAAAELGGVDGKLLHGRHRVSAHPKSAYSRQVCR